MFRYLYWAFVGALLLLLALLHWRAHTPGEVAEAQSQLRFLGQKLPAGGAAQMQAIFPEGYVFSWALYGLAAAEVARQLPHYEPRRAEALTQARTALRRLDSPVGRASFPAGLAPGYGVFYAGWRLYLRANYLRALAPQRVRAAEMAAFTRDCDSLADAFARSPTPMLPSYAGAAWPADNCVAIAALGIHDQIYPPRHQAIITRWVHAARQRLDPIYDALSHAADSGTGAPRGGVRGSSLALMSKVLLDVAPDLAHTQYQVLRTHPLRGVSLGRTRRPGISGRVQRPRQHRFRPVATWVRWPGHGRGRSLGPGARRRGPGRCPPGHG